MNIIDIKNKRRDRRKKSIRKYINGTAQKPRLTVYRSNKYIYIQAIDDENSITLTSESSLKYENAKLNKDTAKKVGLAFGEKLKNWQIQ